MINRIREKYNQIMSQVVVFDRNYVIVASDNFLFPLQIGTNLKNVHPFFETLDALIEKPSKEHEFKSVQLEIGEKSGFYDLIINSGTKTKNPFVILIDFTEHFDSFQAVAQEKNETHIDFHFEEIKNKQLQIQKEFKNKFLANISHDLRTPLGTIIGFLDVLEKSNFDSEQKEVINIIRKTATHIGVLIDDLMDIAKIEAGEFRIKNKSFHFLDLISHIEKTYLQKTAVKNLDFFLELDPKIPKFLVGDRVRLFQLIINLLDNAIKFTQTGFVKLLIKENYRRADNISINIKVIDSGIGFSEEQKDLAFNSFTKLHDTEIDGSGIGLSIVKTIVGLMDGNIKLRTAIGKGTEIELNISLKIDIKTIAKRKNSYVPDFEYIVFKKKYNILIAEDNEISQLLLMKILINHGGFYIDVASNGKQVLDYVAQNQYDLILMDVEMPELNGIETSMFIKKHESRAISRIPIIGLTANVSDEEKEKCKKAGMKYCVSKPYTREELFKIIYHVLKIKN